MLVTDEVSQPEMSPAKLEEHSNIKSMLVTDEVSQPEMSIEKSTVR
jgi:hypothetical protein